MHRLSALMVVCLVFTVAPAARAGDAAAKTSREHLIHLPGIAGARALDRYFLAGIRDGGYRGTIEVIDWPGNEPGLKALLDRQRNEREAAKVARRIAQLLKDDPRLKVRLVGHSGGSGIAAWALERLPEGAQVESVVFVAPALSQRYDLSKALRHVRGKAYAFTSPNDAIVLGAGTSLLGTIDGVKEEAAGLRGFTKPKGADDTQYAKLVPMDYEPGWMQFGNIGDHIGPMGETFAEKVISRILQDRPPEQPATRPATTGPATASRAPKQARGSSPAEPSAEP
jgi:pimeloyl-ACP methyl ester carboxylesterase